MTNFYIDSNVIIAAEIPEEPCHRESKYFMECVINKRKTDAEFYTSVFTFLELAAAMIRRTNNYDRTYSLLYRVRNSWKEAIHPLPPIEPKKMTSFSKFVDILIETSLKFHSPASDTIHVQTIADNKIDYVITWNKKHFSSMTEQIENLKILTPSEMMKEFKDQI